MRMMLFLLLFTSIWSTLSQAQETTWSWQNPLPSGSPLLNIQFLTESEGWVYRYPWHLLHSKDDGQNWETLPRQYFVDFHFLDCDKGVGILQQLIFITNDGGKTWIPSLQDNHFSLQEIQFFDKNHGVITGLYYSGGESAMILVLHTEDGGDHWTQVLGDSVSQYALTSFINPSHGWFVSDYDLLSTNDGGENWEPRADLTLLVPEQTLFYRVTFADTLHGWLWAIIRQMIQLRFIFYPHKMVVPPGIITSLARLSKTSPLATRPTGGCAVKTVKSGTARIVGLFGFRNRHRLM